MTVRALVLAAGLGTRLRPLTDFVPKPLLPVRGRPLIAYTLERLRAAGVEATAINLHHHGERIREALGDEFLGMPLHYSWEREAALGTGGALLPLRDFFAGAGVILVLNGDTLCRWPIKRLLRRHRRSGAAATLLLSERAPTGPYGGGVGIDATGAVVDFWARADSPAQRRYVFAGAHVLSPLWLERLAQRGERPDLVRDLYVPQLEAKSTIQTVRTRAPWHDLGRPNRYLDATLAWRPGGAVRRRLVPGRRGWRAESARIARGTRLRRAVVEGGARIAARSALAETIVFPGAEVGRRCELQRVIVGPGVVLPEGSRIRNRLVTVTKVGQEPVPGQSVLGGLVFTPIDDEAGT